MRSLITIFTLMTCCCMSMFSQSIKPVDMVLSETEFSSTELFTLEQGKRNNKVPADISEYSLLTLNTSSVNSLFTKQTDNLKLALPYQNKNLDLLLVPVDIQSENGYVILQPSGEKVKVNPGLHYRGVVKGQQKSTVAISIFDGEVMGLITSPTLGNLVLGKINNDTDHMLYQDDQISDKLLFECGTEDSLEPYEQHDLQHSQGTRDLSDCTRLYFEVDYDIYQDKGGLTGTTNYVTGLYNQVATMYANENINTSLSPLVIWDQTSPYSSSSSSGMLNQFTAYRQGYDGDLGMLLSYQASGGIAYVDGLCSNNPDFSMSFSSIGSTFSTVPTYSWSVMVVSHEFGHLFGSQHTHACVWNGNNTAIDGCYTTEGGCASPSIPAGGGTVMSYCHLTSAGINLNNGFGPQPGNLIRSRVTNANCLSACDDGGGGPTCTDGVQNGNETGVDCGGPDCPACPTACTDNEATLIIVLDNYPGETTWNITNANGSVLYSGGPYSSAGSTVTQDLCLQDGCFNFTINDSYGDGICCAYGQGSFTISNSGGTLTSGGQFGNTSTNNFCVGEGSQPTCTDGVQNGNETGVDCGGLDCPSCPTCTDGIQNGSETGVDCGGPDCPACISCNDGVQNGNETGVDCGGSDCPACPTCTDGVQNGSETGVDCGGPDCPACTSCNDGVRNGNETGVDCGGSDCPACPTCTDGVQNGNETGVDCGGPDCPDCPTSGCTDNEATLTIVLDNYPGETTWNITDASGTVLYSGGPYSTVGATVTQDLCLLDGCFDFTMNDSYGDGICCAYGQGSYTISNASGTLTSGGQFGSTVNNNFCVGSGSQPTCTDGVQNGNETGVDCGGPDCPACETCSDGVQNGSETGIDCGGPDCEPCDNGGGGNSEEIFAHYFESGWDGWQDGGSDCYRYGGFRSYEGTYSIRIRDNSGAASTMTSSAYDLSTYSGVELSFYFYPSSMESGEDFFVEYYDGSSWQMIANYTSGVDFTNNQYYVTMIPIMSTDFNMASDAKLRIRCDASSNADRVYVDQVVLTSIGGGSLTSGDIEIRQLASTIEDRFTERESAFITPNPTIDHSYLTIETEVAYATTIKVTDVLGQIMYNNVQKLFEGNNEVRLETSDFATGTYFISYTDEEGEATTLKFIKVD